MAATAFRPLHWLVLAFFLLFGLAANAQIDNVYVYGTVKDYNTSKKLDGITVSVLKDGAKFAQVVTSANGKYEFNLDYGHDYKLVFEKPGMVGKNVSINTTSIPEGDRQGGLAMNVEMTLFQELPGIDFKLLQQPIGKSKYDPETKNLSWDLQYTEQIRSEMERLLKEYDDKKKREVGADESYAKAMKAGTDAMAAAGYDKAVKSFTEALGYKPADPVATAKLSDAQIKLNELSAASKKEAQYADLIKTADALFGKKQYEDAKAKYQEATQVKDQEAYPKQKVKECDSFIDDLAKKAEADKKAKELDDKFNAAIASGDAAFKAEKYDQAKTSFTEAQALKPAEKYPPEQLAAIAKKLDEQAKKAEEEAKNKELEAKYQAAITAGDASFKKADYDAAKGKYNEALGLKAKEKYPTDQLVEIDKKLKELADKADADAKAKELEGQYQAAVAAGDAAFKSADYEAAKGKYNEALGLKAKEKYPTDQLAAIEKKLKDLADKADADAKAKELDAQYQAAIAAADASFQTADYDAAKGKYNEALGMKPKEKYPTDQLAAIAKKVKDLADKADADAKAKALDEQYQKLVDNAEKLFADASYTDAKAKYQEALGLKPAEAKPKERIVEIDAKLAELARQADEKKKQDELDAKYAGLISSADKFFKEKKNSDALNNYKDALGLKAGEQYPKDQIATIEQLMDANAKEQAEKDRLAREAKDKDEKYNALIKQADIEFKAKSYDGALSGYEQALDIKADEKYPADQITAIQKLQAELASKSAADSLKAAQDAEERARLDAEKRSKEQSAAELQGRYDAAIAKADAAFKTKDYDPARDGYNEALGIKAEEKYPKGQLAAIDAALAQLSAADSLAAAAAEKARLEAEERARLDAEKRSKDQSAAELQGRYDAAIAKADAAFKTKDYDPAREGYNEALGIKADEKYPKAQLASIDAALAQLNAADSLAAAAAEKARLEAEAARSQADADAEAKRLALEKAKQEREGQQAIDDRFAEVIRNADASMASQDYSAARDLYSQALDIKSTETYPQVKIEQIDKLLAEQARLEAERAKAEQAKVKTPAPPVPTVSMDNRKELEAEDFMREAREREDAEKYGKIKRLKLAVQDQAVTGQEEANKRQEEDLKKNQSVRDGSASLYEGSEEMRKRNAEELEALRQALAERQEALRTQGVAQSQQALMVANAQIEAHADMVTAHQQGSSTAGTIEQRTADAQSHMEAVASAAQERTTAAYAQVEVAQQQAVEMQGKGSGLAIKQQQASEQFKEQESMHQRELANAGKDRSAGEKERLSGININAQRSNAEYGRNKLAEEYPQGVTEESYTEGNKVIIRRVVVQGNKANAYSKVIAKWGTFYFKDGQPISEQNWSVNTEQ